MDEFSSAVLAKARKYVDTDQVRPDDTVPGVWWVKTYRVGVVAGTYGDDLWWTCTCRHGLNNPGQARCSHVAAVQAMREHGDSG